MRPGLDQLEALLWIARLGSFRAAAQRLHLSQPAVSGRIRELESALGFLVIDRTGHRPAVTPQGVEVLRHAEQMIGIAENFRDRFANHRLGSVSIRLGAADSFAIMHLSPLLRRITDDFPSIRIELDIDFSANLDRKLRAQDLDIAFLTSPGSAPFIRTEPLLPLELAWLASPKLGLGARRILPADLLGYPILTNPRPSHLYRTILDWFAAAGCVPDRLYTCTSLAIIAQLAVDGLGIAVLPLPLAKRELARGKLDKLAATPSLPPHHIAVAYRMDTGANLVSRVAGLAHSVVSR
jgi:DNA-binding transcriptional LysR family regulator